MPEVKIYGKTVGFDARPEDFDPSDLVIVCIHGTGGDRYDWTAQLEGLSDCAVIMALELPGHGASEGPGETSVQAYAGHVAAFIEHFNLKKVVVVGFSLGSAVALWLMLHPKPWLTAGCLVGAGARLRVSPAFLDGVLLNKDKALEMMTDSALSATPDPTLRAAVKEKFATYSSEIIHADLSACNEFDVTKDLGRISLPTAIIVGEEDKLTPVKYSRFLHDALPHSQLTVIPKAGHFVMLEQPAEFNACMRAFLSTLPK